MKVCPVIISGGAGSRLWPVSRKLHPKPFMRLPDGETLMFKTYMRAVELPDVAHVMTVTNKDLYFRTRDESIALKNKGVSQSFLLEPCGRNTAPAIIAAAIRLRKILGPEAIMLVMPADHLMQKLSAFKKAVEQAIKLAEKNKLVTFGIKPTHAETGFGYIHALDERVLSFVEKPDANTAEKYLQSNEYFWNAGIFCFSVKTLIAEVEAHAPILFQQVSSAMATMEVLSTDDVDQLMLSEKAFSEVSDISIDYALLEKSENVAVVPCDLGWSDIGSWESFSQLFDIDKDNNSLNGDVVAVDTYNSFIHSPNTLTATVGLSDVIIIQTPDATLVADRQRSQDVKDIVTQLAASGHEARLLHRTVYRPWGSYTTLEEGDNFKIKRIVVKPNQSLSLQRHHHRSEHWVVVSGMARIVNDNKECLLSVNESTFIPAGHSHRLENPGVIDLVLIEVQSGEYLGEDDIVRFEDSYGRK